MAAWTGIDLMSPGMLQAMRGTNTGLSLEDFLSATRNPPQAVPTNIARTQPEILRRQRFIQEFPRATNASGVLETRNKVKNQVLNTGFARTTNPVSAASMPAAQSASADSISNSGIPAWLQNPESILGSALTPYADILSRIFAPTSASGVGMAIPPDLARAYSDAAAAQAARTRAQTSALQNVLSLPGQISDANSRARDLVSSGQSLYGLPTGLGYIDPAARWRNQAFDLQTQLLPGSTMGRLAQASATGSGWLPALPTF